MIQDTQNWQAGISDTANTPKCVPQQLHYIVRQCAATHVDRRASSSELLAEVKVATAMGQGNFYDSRCSSDDVAVYAFQDSCAGQSDNTQQHTYQAATIGSIQLPEKVGMATAEGKEHLLGSLWTAMM